MTGFGDFVKTATRPVLAVMFGIALVAAEFEGIELSMWFKGLATASLGEWFIERGITHAKGK